MPLARYAFLLVLLFAPSHLLAQRDRAPSRPASQFTSKSDSLNYLRYNQVANSSKGFRVIVSLFDRRLFVLRNSDTLYSAPVAIASGATLEYGTNRWVFKLPRGLRRVQSKKADPIWRPPLWHYAEIATQHGLKLKHITPGRPIRLSDGGTLSIRGDTVGLRSPGGPWLPMLETEEIIFGNTLYIAPPHTIHGFLPKTLGPYALYLGDGFALHGTTDKNSIGQSVTHGCLRLTDQDITWLYENIPLGTRVYIY